MKISFLPPVRVLAALLLPGAGAPAQASPGPASPASSYLPVDGAEDFSASRQRLQQAKPALMQAQHELLAARYDLSDQPAAGVTMTGAPQRAATKPFRNGFQALSQGRVCRTIQWQL